MADIRFDICCSTKFIEYGVDLFFQEIDGMLFELKVEQDKGNIHLCLGTANATDAARRIVEEKLSSCLLPKEKIIFFEYYVMISICIEEGYTDRLNNATDILLQWAKESKIKSGCFLCGKTNEFVMIRELDGISSYLCNECEESHLQKKGLQEAQDKFLKSTKVRTERVAKGIRSSLLARAVLSVIFIPLFISMLLADLSSYGGEVPALVLGLIVTIPSMVLICIVYRKNAEHISFFGYSYIVVWTILSLVLDFAIAMLIANQMSLSILGKIPDSKLLGILQNPNIYSSVSVDDLGLYTKRVPTRTLLLEYGAMGLGISIIAIVIIDYFWHDEHG